MLSSIAQRFGLSPRQFHRQLHFIFLAAAMMAIAVSGYAAASAYFLSVAGAARIPLVYLIMGVLALPIYAGLAQLIDRTPRLSLFQRILLVYVAVAVVLRFLADGSTLPVCFAVYISFYVGWTVLVDIMLPSLAADYFTAVELKRTAPLTALGIAMGGLIGGSLALLLAKHCSPSDLFLVPALLAVIAVGQLRLLQRTAKPLDAEREPPEAGMLQALRDFGPLVRRYPIVVYLALGTTFFVLLNCIAEYLVFTIFAREIPDGRHLAGFLGTLMALQSILQFGLIYFVSRPLLDRLGVAGANMIYPVTTLGSFLGLFFHTQLPTAIAANLNYDSFYQSFDKPVHSLNFNALPYRFVGRVKTIADGMFYAVGIVLAGLFLLAAGHLLTEYQIALIGIIIAAAFVVLRLLQGRSYLQGMINLVRSGSINLEDAAQPALRLPDSYLGEIKDLIASGSPEASLLAIQLAARLQHPAHLDRASLERLLRQSDSGVRRNAVKLIGRLRDAALTQHLRTLLSGGDSELQLAALAALVGSGEALSLIHI